MITVGISDNCGIDEKTIRLTYEGLITVPTVSGGATAKTIEWTSFSPAMYLDDVINLRVEAEDLSGNKLDQIIKFRNWDTFSYFFRSSPGCSNNCPGWQHMDSSAPNTVTAAAEAWTVAPPGGTAAPQRMLGNPNITPAEASGTVVIDAELELCSNQQVSTTTNVTCYELNSDFVDSQATWNSRKTATAWGSAGADAVPGDREGTGFGTVVFPSGQAPYNSPPGPDITAQMQVWIDASSGSGSPGFVCTSDAVLDLLGNNSNCPPQISGHLGRPLP